VRAATVGLWLASLAAAGVSLCVLGAGTAPARAEAYAARSCDASEGAGLAERVTYRLRVNGQSVDRAVLKPRDELSTDSSGTVDICLKLGETACRFGGDTVVRILPSRGVLLRISRSTRRVTCETTTGTAKQVKTPEATIVLDTARRRAQSVGATPPARKAVYSIEVLPKQTTVDVINGALLVAKGNRVAKAVVARRNECVVVSARQSKVRAFWGCGVGQFRTRGRFANATLKG
jgi:hypothetical protein